MGYTTEFVGQFNFDKPLSFEHKEYLKAFASSRRMKRNEVIAGDMKDPYRIAVGLPIGEQGSYFVGLPNVRGNFMGQKEDSSVIDFNSHPVSQPGLWCQWVPNEDGTAMVWDGSEKFYNYIEWIQYLIKHFIAPWGYTLNGVIEWSGEEYGDIGKITIVNNVLSTEEESEVKKTLYSIASDLAEAISEAFDGDYDEIHDAIKEFIKTRM